MCSFFVFAVASIEYPLEAVLKTEMTTLRCIPPFSTNLAFNRLDLQLVPHRMENQYDLFYPIHRVLDTEKVRAEYEKSKDKLLAFKFSEVVGETTEVEVVQNLASALKNLCSKVILEKKEVHMLAGHVIDDIGIGSMDTWHGSPDMRLVAATRNDSPVDVLVSSEEDEEDEDKYPPTDAEVKKDFHCSVKSQLVGITVTNSFINLSTHKVECTVSLLLCHRRVQLCLYDCVHDVLSLSEELALFTPDGKTSYLGVLLVWIALHFQ